MKKIGRFEVVRELGRGAQSVVYLCNDPHLQREVAIKTLHFVEADRRLSAHLLAEARMVSKLRHTNIVPIFEAGEQDGDPYLVFEYIAGESLAQVLRKGPLDSIRGATILAPVLDALAEAHGQSIIHRDLKPSNIIIDSKGAPRVMDFGIAMRAAGKPNGEAGKNQTLMGTLPYMAPEYVRDRTSDERSDIYAIGLVLIEMLAGQRVRLATSVPAMLASITEQPVRLKEEWAIDERMAAIALKAVDPEPAKRYQDAAQMAQALRDYVNPPDALSDGEVGSGREKQEAVVDFLLRRMRHKTDFPALSDSVTAINRITNSDKESINRLSNTILRDYALTAKILRLVNSPVYRQSGGGTISTVSRAVVVLGFDAVRNIALTLVMFEHLKDKANAAQIKESFLKANLSGLLGRDIGLKMSLRETEEVFICAMFHDLGRLLVQFYFPDEVEEIRRLSMQKECSQEAAAYQVLGTSFGELGATIARYWGFPESMVESMRPMPPGVVKKPATRDAMVHLVACFSNELCDSIANTPPEERAKAMKQISDRFAAGVRLPDGQFKELMQKAVGELEQIAISLQINLKQSQFVRQALAWGGGVAHLAGAGSQAEDGADGSDWTRSVMMGVGSPEGAGFAALQEGAQDAADGARVSPDGNVPEDAQATLAAGIQDISNSLVDDFSLNDVLRIILETMYRAMRFDRVLLCVRDAKTNSMMGRFGFGADTGEMVPHFRFSLAGDTDVFRAAALKGIDLIISDINDPNIGDRIPEWYRSKVPAETFVLFPLILKGTPVAMIYCDRRHAGDIMIPPQVLSLLKTLRNQALLAIKQGR